MVTMSIDHVYSDSEYEVMASNVNLVKDHGCSDSDVHPYAMVEDYSVCGIDIHPYVHTFVRPY